MDRETVELLIKLFGALAVIGNVVGALLAWVWHRHVKELDEQKKEMAGKATQAALNEVKAQHQRELTLARDDLRLEIEKLERRHRDEVEALRSDLNGVANRLAIAMDKSEANLIARLEHVGLMFQQQMSSMIKAVEASGRTQDDMAASLAEARESIASLSSRIG